MLAVLLLATAGGMVLAQSKVSGTVHDASGEPVAGAVINLEPSEPGQPVLKTKTRKKGQYFFAMVREGKYRLVAQVENMRVSAIAIQVRDKDGRTAFEVSGPVAPGSAPPEFEVGDTDTATYDITLSKSSGGSGEFGTGIALLGTGEIVDLIQSGKLDKARSELRRGLEANADDPKMHYLMAYLEMQEKNPEAAVSAIDRALAADPSFPGAHLLKGVLEEQLGNSDVAVAEFRQEIGVAQDPQLKRDSWVHIARISKARGETTERIEALQHIIGLDPTNSVAYAQLIDIYARSGRYDDLDALMKTSPPDVANDPAIWYNIGAAHWNQGEPARAQEALDNVVRLDPTMADAYKLLGYCKANLGDFAGAVTEMKKYLELEPGAPDAAEVQAFVDAVAKKADEKKP